MITCVDCDEEYNPDTVHKCSVVSGVDDSFEDLIREASVPNLAALFRAGKDRGLITPGSKESADSA